MITITPQGSVYLCKTPLENDYKHQLTFANATAQRNYFTGSSVLKHTCTDFTYIKRDNQLIVDLPIDTIIDCNYLYYKNTGFTTKYYYCFITNMEYVNENATRITFEIDAYQTYMFDIVYKKSFVEREHVNDDTVGKNLVPEGLETGDFIVNGIIDDGFSGSTPVVILATTIDPALDPQSATPTNIGGNNGGGVYNGVKNGLKYYSYNLSSTSLPQYLEGFANAGQLDAINSLFMIPRAFISTGSEDLDDKPVPENTAPFDYIWAIDKQTTLDSYTPVNNKLLTGEYNFLYLTNNNGGNAIYKYEYFDDNERPGKAVFEENGAICPGGSVFIHPYKYKKGTNNYSEGIPGGKYPICGWQSDVYTNWLTQNALSIKLGVWGAAGQIIGGLTTGVAGASTEGVSMAAGGLNSILHQMADWKQKQLTPNQAEGNINSGDVMFAIDKTRFSIYKMTITYNYAKRIDDYFSTYGYKVNEFKTPNVTGRTYWNYVKTLECNLEGNIPQVYLNKLKEMFNNGVTFWHDSTKFLDYSQSNTIVS